MSPIISQYLALILLISMANSQPVLPLPSIDIPSNLNPPFAHGRVDVHGWLWLPIYLQTNSSNSQTLFGYFYHHTPEFETHSPHDFEIMAFGFLTTEKFVPNLPYPQNSPVVGTEYTFTPPEFSLDDVVTGQLQEFQGKFQNGSFDTPQRYLLSMAQFTIQNLVTVHYLIQNATAGYPELVYYSYPRDPYFQDPDQTNLHFYFLHLLEKSPDFDQIVHVTIKLSTCQLAPGDSLMDLVLPSANFVVPGSVNDVMHRLAPSSKPITVNLVTNNNRNGPKTSCKAFVLEENHCVVVPDSFANCPKIVS